MNAHAHINIHICGQCGKEYNGSKAFSPTGWNIKLSDDNQKILICDDCSKLDKFVTLIEQPTIIGLSNITVVPMPVQNSIAVFCDGERINFTLSESEEIVDKFSEANAILNGKHQSQIGER